MILSFDIFIKESLDSDILSRVDYTLLNPDATENDIIELCEKAENLGVKSVCVRPNMVSTAAYALKRSDVLVCTVVSFPHGTDSIQEKLAETREAISDGADEVDMVLNYPILKQMTNDMDEKSINDKFSFLEMDVYTLVEECHKHTNKDGNPITLKVIVESGLLSDDETENATYVCINAGADFIKTSTGMVNIGAELSKVQIMKRIINEENSNLKIKASGGIRTLADLQKFDPYVDRFGVGFTAIDNIFGGNKNKIEGSY